MIHTGDCLQVMPTLPENSVDAIVTDPPYGLGFMGKEWDHGVPGKEFWLEALRVAKPGAHLVAFGGTRTYHRLTCAIEDAGWEIRDCLSWLYGSGFPKSHNGEWGGTALKPAWEPIVLARKPLIGTVAANVTAHGTGGLNIDGCRIGDGPVLSHGSSGSGRATVLGEYQREYEMGGGREYRNGGRWPANVCLDEEAGRLLDEQSGERKAGGSLNGSEPSRPAKNTYGEYTERRQWESYGDTGGASRFYYCAKASKSERGEGNTHPTVKPMDLMRWLCRLVTPPGGIILDPFMGSGTTGCAATLEGFLFIGIEQSAEYAEIATKRIAHHTPNPTLL